MYLILPTEEAFARNNQEAIRQGCQPPVLYWWHWEYLNPETIWLNVGNGDGLTDDEKAQCVETIGQ